MCPNKDWFTIYEKFNGGNVLMENDAACKAIDICSVQIKMHDCVVKILTEVRHVLDLKKNLISLSVMNGKGYKRSEKDIF